MFFREYKDTSKDTIAEAAALLNRTPKRQGSNQYVIESVFDNEFKKHPDHEQIVNGRGKKTEAEQKYINTYHERLAKINREKNPEKFAAYDKKQAEREAAPKRPSYPTNLKDAPKGYMSPQERAAQSARETSYAGPGNPSGKAKSSMLDR